MPTRYTTRLKTTHDPRIEDFKLLAKAKKTRREIGSILGLDKDTVNRWAKMAHVKVILAPHGRPQGLHSSR